MEISLWYRESKTSVNNRYNLLKKKKKNQFILVFLYCTELGPQKTFNLLLCAVYLGHTVTYDGCMIYYLTGYNCKVLYVQYDVTHLEGKSLCDR